MTRVHEKQLDNTLMVKWRRSCEHIRFHHVSHLIHLSHSGPRLLLLLLLLYCLSLSVGISEWELYYLFSWPSSVRVVVVNDLLFANYFPCLYFYSGSLYRGCQGATPTRRTMMRMPIELRASLGWLAEIYPRRSRLPFELYLETWSGPEQVW